MLIGTPEQIEKGVEFTIALDSALKLGQLIKLEMSIMELLKKQPNSKPTTWAEASNMSLLEYATKASAV